MSPDLPAVLPAQLVEAAARALHEYDRIKWLNEPRWDDVDEMNQDSYRKAVRAVLAAALAECGVGEEFSCLAAGHPTWHRHRCPDTLQRRLVFKTKPEPVASPVDTPREDTKP